MRALVVLVVVLLWVPLASGQGSEVDVTVVLDPLGPPSVDAPPGWVVVADGRPGQRYELDLRLPGEFTTLEVRARDFGLERPRQLVPSLVLGEEEYPLFHEFPNERVWEAEGAVRVFHASSVGSDVRLRLGVDGPRNVTLVLEVDREPPAFSVGERRDVSHFGFYQESSTEELALADLQVRAVGGEEWVRNPTPIYHFLQRFPVQGLDADREYETRLVFEDWAGNVAVSEVSRVRTAVAPVFEAPVIEIVSPAPNSTANVGGVVVRAKISSSSEVASDGVRLFFDLREVTPDVEFAEGEVVFVPQFALVPGVHRVSIEVENADGGRADARWSFTVPGATAQTPLPAWVVLFAFAGAAAGDMSRRRRQR